MCAKYNLYFTSVRKKKVVSDCQGCQLYNNIATVFSFISQHHLDSHTNRFFTFQYIWDFLPYMSAYTTTEVCLMCELNTCVIHNSYRIWLLTKKLFVNFIRLSLKKERENHQCCWYCRSSTNALFINFWFSFTSTGRFACGEGETCKVMLDSDYICCHLVFCLIISPLLFSGVRSVTCSHGFHWWSFLAAAYHHLGMFLCFSPFLAY